MITNFEYITESQDELAELIYSIIDNCWKSDGEGCMGCKLIDARCGDEGGLVEWFNQERSE